MAVENLIEVKASWPESENKLKKHIIKNMPQISVINIRAGRTKGNAGKSFVLQWFGSNYWLRAEAPKKGQAAGGVSPKRKLSTYSGSHLSKSSCLALAA